MTVEEIISRYPGDYWRDRAALMSALDDYYSGRGASALARRWVEWVKGLKPCS